MTIRRHFTKLIFALLACIVAGMIGLYFWILADLPNVDTYTAGLALPATRIYDRHGELLYEILPPEQGRNRAVPLAAIPPACQHAAIAVEDANYWQHPGIDPVGIARAAWINIRGGQIIAGGSTITQQTARLLLMDFEERSERTVRRKLREMVLAIQLQNRTSKERVLELYLNQVYFGNLAYGVEAAAQTYFHKSANELSVGECALLIGVVQNPVAHDPLSNLDSARARQETALRLMVQNDYLTATEAESAANDPLQFGSTRFPIEAPHFVMAVWKQLERTYPDALYTRGLDVTTTLDLNWHRAAHRIVNEQLDALNHPQLGNGIPANANNAALVAMDPFTGQVLTMLGSPDYFDETIDGAVNAALALRQPGSALKPFTYAAALDPTRENPMAPATVLLDVATPFVTQRLESYTPLNYGLVEHGPVSIRESLGSSYNIPAVVALEVVGVERFIQLASDLGLHSLVENPHVDLSITLGGGEVRLLDLTAAYSALPNGGSYVEPAMILEVRDQNDEVLYEWHPPRQQPRVLDERVAWLITDMLSDNHARIPSFGRNSAMQIGRPAAAKTGTTTDFRDNWILGYTPNLVVGVWVGNADNSPMIEVTGVSGAGPIYNQFMRRVLQGQPELPFPPPPGLIEVEVCALSGLLPTEDCPRRVTDWFIPGTQPTDYDNVYQTMLVDRRTGALADDSTPLVDRVPQTFVVLPPEAQDWAITNGLRVPPRGYLPVGEDDPVRLLSPDPYTQFEISPVVPLATQRLRFQAAVPSDSTQVTFKLNGDTLAVRGAASAEMWWTLAPGEHELTVEATLPDGRVETSEAVLFSVVDYTPPEERTILPGE